MRTDPTGARLIGRRLLATLTLAGFVAVSPRAFAYGCPTFDDGKVVDKIAAVESALKAAWQFLFRQLTDQYTKLDGRIIAATKVATAQIATVTKAEINVASSLALGEIAAIGHLETVKEQLRAYQDYSPTTGQGFDPCSQLAAQNNLALARERTVGVINQTLEQVAAAPGRYGSPEAWLNRMLSQRQAQFATEDEAKLGFGSASRAEVTTATGLKFPLAGADTNARVLFADSADPKVLAAKAAYLNHMAGAPDLAPTADLAQTPAGKEYRVLKARKDAVTSAALYSLASVSAENTPNPDTGKSPMQATRELVGQYYGRSAGERWKGWASQSERGLQVDQMKMDAALLAIKADQYRSGQRQEVLLGAMLALEVQREYAPRLDAAAREVAAPQARPSTR